MSLSSEILQFGENVVTISKEIAAQRLSLKDYRDYYSQVTKHFSDYVNITKDYFADKEPPLQPQTAIRKRLHSYEIMVWQTYISFKEKNLTSSLHEILLFCRYYFIKNSDYRKKLDNIKELRKELENPHTALEMEDRLLRFREVGRLYSELSGEKIIKDVAIFWAIVAVIIAVLAFIFNRG